LYCDSFRTIGWPVHKIFQTDDLISRRGFIATTFFNEWMRPAEFGVAAVGANLLVGNEISTIFPPGKDEISEEQARIFKAVPPHIDRAIRIHRRLQLRDITGGTLENAQAMAAHESPRTTKLYDRTDDEITLDEVERIAI
jgi:hypothetical protein